MIYTCPLCAEEAVPASHFDFGGCGYVTPGLIKWIEGHAEGRPEGWSVTEIMGPAREKILKESIHIYDPGSSVKTKGGMVGPARRDPIDPRRYWKAFAGQAIHDMHEKFNGTPTRWYGEIHGLKVSGLCDVVKDNLIVDYKNTKWIPWGAEDVKEEHAVQVSLYAELHRQVTGKTIDRGAIAYTHEGLKPGHPMVRFFNIMDLEECLNFKVAGGEIKHQGTATTVDGEVAGYYGMTSTPIVTIKDNIEDILDWQSLGTLPPCLCDKIMFGKKSKKEGGWCDAKGACDAIGR